MIPIHSATNKLNTLNRKCKANPRKTRPEMTNLNPLKAILELNPIERILPRKKIDANV